MIGRCAASATLLAIVAAWTLGCDVVGSPEASVPAEPVVDCLAAPPETCRQALADAAANAPAGERPVRVRLTCSLATCTAVNGAAQVDVWYSDGSIESYATEWAGPGDEPAPGDSAPILSVVPLCIGLDLARCRDMARNIIVPVGSPGLVLSIVVTCRAAACTATEGRGTTRVTFQDGTMREADWAYAGDLEAP